MEVDKLVVLGRNDLLDALFVLFAQGDQLFVQVFLFVGLGLVFLDLGEVGARGDVADRRNDLQLRSALVNVRDTRVAVNALDRVVFHVARAAENLDRIVG